MSKTNPPKTSQRKFSDYIDNVFAAVNPFSDRAPASAPLPTFDAARAALPQPFWDGHGAAIACYWRCWELAFRNLRQPTKENGFVCDYIDTAFNNHLFLWDSCFILMFGKYGRRAFDFQRTLDNLYSKQHRDGFICRELSQMDGGDLFERHDPVSTGPNVLAWAEWEYFLTSGDGSRLADAFWPLLAYHQWMAANRTWPDGSYWSSGLGCGMDNQPRLPRGAMPSGVASEEQYIGFSTARMTWCDATLQQMLSARLLLEMAARLGLGAGPATGSSASPGAALAAERLPAALAELRAEGAALQAILSRSLWDERTAFFYDRFRDGSLGAAKSIGAYWALLADALPAGEQRERFVGHLSNPDEFDRPHPIPTLSADDPEYRADGDYWRGGVWAPTNYMTLRGLTHVGHDDLAYRIGRRHVDVAAEVFEATGTVWENYAPEAAIPGRPAKADFVGWSGLGPIAVLLEYVMGLRPDAQSRRLVWDVRLVERHGVAAYPFGLDGSVDLECAARATSADEPRVRVHSSAPVEVELRWPGGSSVVRAGD